MRGSVFCCVISGAVATGCWHGHEEGSDACSVVLVRPGNVNEEVAIRPTLRLEWSTAVDVGSARVSVRELGGREVPVTLTPESDRVATVTTDHSLRFDTVYTIDVDPVAARDDDDGTCSAATTAFHTLAPYEVEQPQRMASLEGLAIVGGYVVGVSRAYRGLQVFDIAQPDAPALVASLATAEHPSGIVVQGTRAYLPAGHDGVVVVDLSTPRAPRRLGHIGTPGMALGAAAFERAGVSYLAIADGVEGVRIVDVTDVAAPRTVSVYDPSGARAADVRSIDVDGDVLAVADGNRGYVVVDISSPGAPRPIGAGYAGRAAIDIAMDRGLVYVSHFPGFIDVYDARVPALPRVGGLQACDVCMQRYPAFLHEASGQLHVSAAREGVRTFALDGQGGMTLLGLRRTPGPAFAVVETADRVYIGEEGGLVGFDRSTFGGPRFYDPTGHGVAASISVDGDRAYVAAASRGLQVFSVADAEHPALESVIATPASPTGDVSAAFVTVASGALIVGDVRGGLVTFDRTSSPDAPIVMGQVRPTDGVTKVIEIRPGTVLACQGNTGMLLADVSDPSAPTLIAERFFRDIAPVTPDYCNDLDYDAANRVAYVAGNGGITVLEVGDGDDADPLRILRRVQLPSRDAVTSLARSGRVLYAATRVADFEGRDGLSHRLQVLQLADPREPAWVSTTEDLGALGTLTLVGDKLFAAARDLGVYVFDVSTSDEPFLEYVVPTRGDAISFAATARSLYVAESAGGLGVIHTGPLPVDDD